MTHTGGAQGGLSTTARICARCLDEVGATGAGVSIVTVRGNRGVVCATDGVAARIEELQFTLGEGPCIDAVRGGGPVMVPDIEDPDDLLLARWPGFLDGAADLDVRAIFAFPLRIGAVLIGAMDVYRDRPGELTPSGLAAALVAADEAALSLLDLDLDVDPGVDHFLDNVRSRSSYQLEVHQATGMLQVQTGLPTESALIFLRAHAFAAGRPLIEIATDIVERRLRFTPEDL